MFSIIVAILIVIKIYSNAVHSLPKYIGSHYQNITFVSQC